MYRVLLLLCYLSVPVTHADQTITVRTALLADIASYPERTAPATVISLNASTISAEIPARVTAFPVRVGDIVKTGQILVRLDCTDFEIQERQSLANIDSLDTRIGLARKQLERTRTLRQQDSVSEEVQDERITQLALLEAERNAVMAALDGTRLNLSRCEVASPFDALVTERISAIGQFAATGTPLVKLLDIANIEISAQVTTDDISHIVSALDLDFIYSGRRYPLTLRAVLAVINQETRNQEVRLEFSQDTAITGASGKLVWRDPRPHIPASLLVRRGQEYGVFAERNGLAIFHHVADAQPGRSAPIDLPGNTSLVIEGHFSLQDKVQVQVEN